MVIHNMREFKQPADKVFQKYHLRLDDNDEMIAVVQQIVKWESAEQINIVDLRSLGIVDKFHIENILALPNLERFELFTTRHFESTFIDELRSINQGDKWNIVYTYPSQNTSKLLITKASKGLKFWSKSLSKSSHEQEQEIELNEHITEAIHALLAKKPSEHQEELNVLTENIFIEQRNEKGELISLTQNAL